MRWPKFRRGDDRPTPTVQEPRADQREQQRRRIRWSRAIAYGVLPGLALLLASAAGFLKCSGRLGPRG